MPSLGSLRSYGITDNQGIPYESISNFPISIVPFGDIAPCCFGVSTGMNSRNGTNKMNSLWPSEIIDLGLNWQRHALAIHTQTFDCTGRHRHRHKERHRHSQYMHIKHLRYSLTNISQGLFFQHLYSEPIFVCWFWYSTVVSMDQYRMCPWRASS